MSVKGERLMYFQFIISNSRIEAIERLDEMELLRQLLEHYCIVHAIIEKSGKWEFYIS